MAEVTVKKECRLCKTANLEQFLDLGEQPPANAFLKEEDFELEKRYPLVVTRCTNKACGFVQLAHVVNPDTLFRDYVYVSSTSPAFVRHFEQYAQIMHDRLDLSGELAVDIGSNDGVLLKPLKKLGARVLGVDPAIKISEEATKANLETVCDYFTESLARKIVKEHGKAKLIAANNVFAHIDDLDEVMRGVKVLLSDDGLFVIEAPYIMVFLEQRLFDTVYHEHLSYISLKPLKAFFEKFDMHIVDVEMVSSHGGSARIMVAHKKSPHQISPAVEEMIAKEKEKKIFERSVYQVFAKEVEENRKQLLDLLKKLKGEGKKIAGYGAPAKGNTLLNFMDIGPDLLDYIIDDNPKKQGLFTPGTHIPVVPATYLEEHRPDYLFILAWNFAKQIIEKNTKFKSEGGLFIIPVPKPPVVI